MVKSRRQRPFKARANGTFRVNLTAEVRQFLARLATEISEVVAHDVPETRRLFPTAYPDDPEKDAGYQVLARDQLVDQRRNAADTLQATADNDILTEEELAQWMSVINDARLVLGTRLDVSEDSELDIDDPNFELYLIYEDLGYLLDSIVKVMITALPEPRDDIDPPDVDPPDLDDPTPPGPESS